MHICKNEDADADTDVSIQTVLFSYLTKEIPLADNCFSTQTCIHVKMCSIMVIVFGNGISDLNSNSWQASFTSCFHFCLCPWERHESISSSSNRATFEINKKKKVKKAIPILVVKFSVPCMYCPVGWGYRKHWPLLCRGVRPPPNECPEYMALNNLMVRFQRC